MFANPAQLKESFLHYIWQYQYFHRERLMTASGEPVKIFKQGLHNQNAGPDFLEAKIKIGPIEWAGSVEIHIKSSDYLLHKHQNDRSYDNIILHVVWQNDKSITRSDGTTIPTLELRNRVEDNLVKEYRKLINSGFQIPCTKSFSRISGLVKISMIEQAAIQRLNSKAFLVRDLYRQNDGDWEETFYQVLAKNFGFKINAEPLVRLSKALPLRILRKHSSDLLKIEALLFGMAGFLDVKQSDPYHTSLKREFEFLARKFDLEKYKLDKSQWRFLRLRPANFPTVRLAHLATLIHQSTPLFDYLLNAEDIDSIKSKFSIVPSTYWTTHYSFGKKSKLVHGKLGDASVDNLLTNSLVPTLAAYAIERGEEKYFSRALKLWQQVKPETNAITKAWQSLGLEAVNAFDSQGLIEQMNMFCKKRNCLNCSVGVSILKPT